MCVGCARQLGRVCAKTPREEVRYRGVRAGREGRVNERNVEATDEDVRDVRAPRERVVGRVGDVRRSAADRGPFVVREAEERERLRRLLMVASGAGGDVSFLPLLPCGLRFGSPQL